MLYFVKNPFSLVIVFSASAVVLSSHSVFSLLFLVSSFIFSAFLLFVLECEFLALIFIVVYIGAVAVLFLFAVMMLDAKLQNLTRNLFKYLPAGFLLALGFLVPILFHTFFGILATKNFSSENKSIYLNWYDVIDSISDAEVYGQILYSYFVLQFLLAGLILLVVLIGIIYLTNNYKSNRAADQLSYKQLSISSKFFY